MRAGRHFAVFTQGDAAHGMIGIIRPVQFNGSSFTEFGPSNGKHRAYLSSKRTDRWSESNVHCCCVWGTFGEVYWQDWKRKERTKKIDGIQSRTPIGLLLDLDEGALSVYQNGERLAVAKDGLSGEYCWYTELYIGGSFVTIQRG